MLSIQTILFLVVLSFSIVPTLQYGTIFADNISTPDNFTDITETYIQGVKSDVAHANTATVDMITATNPDGFYINSVGPLTISASEWDVTSAQSIKFGLREDGVDVELYSAGTAHVQSDRTDVDSDVLNFISGKAIHFSSLGSLLMKGENINIQSEGAGSVTGRDVVMTSASYVELESDYYITINSTNGLDLVSKYGSIIMEVTNKTTFFGNYINVEADNGVYIHAGGLVTLNAYGVLALQAAQFAQITSEDDLSILVDEGTAEIIAASTASIGTDEYMVLFAGDELNLYSLGDSESSIHFVAVTGQFQLESFERLTIGSLLNSYDVDIIAAGPLSTIGGDSIFTANEQFSVEAYGSINTIVENDMVISGYDYDASSYNQTTISSGIGSTNFTSLQDLSILSGGDVILYTNNFINTYSTMFTLLQAVTASLSRAEPDDMTIIAETFETTSRTSQFDTNGVFSLGADTISVSAQNLDIRSSNGPNVILFEAADSVNINALGSADIKTESSVFNINSASDYNTTSTTVSMSSSMGHDILSVSNFVTDFNTANGYIISGEDTIVDTSSTEFVLSDGLFLDSYNTRLRAFAISTLPTDKAIFGAKEYMTFQSALTQLTSGDDTTINVARSTGMFGDSISLGVNQLANFNSDANIYFIGNLITDSATFTTVAGDFQFTGNTIFESGNDLLVNADQLTVTGDSAILQGYDNVDVVSQDFTVQAGTVDYFADGQLNLVAASMIFTGASASISGNELYFHSADNIAFTTTSYTATSENAYYTANQQASITGDNRITITSVNSVSIESAFSTITASLKATTFDGRDISYHSMNNFFSSTGLTAITADTFYFNATQTNDFNAPHFISNTNVETDLFGDSLQTLSDTISFTATCCKGYFYSDDQITFDVLNDITIITNNLLFKIPLDGSLYLEGADTTLSSGLDSKYTSDGETLIRAHGDLDITADDDLFFESDTLEFNIYDDFRVTAANGGVTYNAVDANVYIESITSTSESAMTTLYYTPRDVLISSVDNTRMETNTGTANYAVPSNFLTKTGNPIAENLGILVETVTNDGNIVFDSNQGITYTVTRDTYINTAGTELLSAQLGFFVTAGNNLNYAADDNLQLATDAGASFTATNGLLTITSGDNQYFEGETVSFTNTLSGTANVDGFRITADSMIISSAQHGDLTFEEQCSLLTFITDESQSWAYTNTFTRNLATETVNAGNDILMLTSSGFISFAYDDLSLTATVNLTYNSGHYSTFTQDNAIYNIGRDAITLSLDGEINFVNGGDQTFLATGGVVSLDSRGTRTSPRDGVYLFGSNVEYRTSGDATSIFVNAKRSVAFGDATVPTEVNFNAGGGPTINGFLIASDGDFYSVDTATTVYDAADEFDITTSQGTSMSSGQSMSITASGTGTDPANILIQSVIGDVFLHSDHDFSLTAATTLTSTATNLITFTTLKTLTVDTALLTETANSLTMNIFDGYSSSAADTYYDGQTFVAVTTAPDSHGSISFSGSNVTHTSRGNFNAYTFGEDGLMDFKTTVLSISTKKSGDITFTSASDLTINSGALFDITSNRSIAISSIDHKGDDSADGYIRFFTSGAFTASASDTISYTAEGNANILAGSLTVSSTGTFTVETYNDQEWYLGADPSSTEADSFFDVTKDVYMRNSPGSGGDISIESAGLFDRTFISADGPITQNINADLHYYSSFGTRIYSIDSDFKDEFGIRFQTELPGANLAIESGNTISFQSSSNIAFDSIDLEILGEIGVSISSQGVDLNNVGVEFISAFGDIFINSTHSYTDFVGNSFLVLGNGTTSNTGKISLTAHGIDETTSFGMRFTSERGQFMLGSTLGDISVTATESIEFLLDDQYAYGLFGFQRNYPDSQYALLPYYYFLDPYIPSNQIYPYLQSKTLLVSSGVNADIYIDTQAGNSDNGQFVAWAGTNEPLLYSHLYAHSQLQMVAHGNGDATGDITFIHQNTMELRGSNLPTLVNQRDVFFLANEYAADIDVRNTKNAIGADIYFNVAVINIGAENKLNIRSIARNGDSGISVYFDRRVQITTTGHSTGAAQPSTDLPGIEFRTYRSSIYNDADYGDVVYQALRNMYLVSNNGFEFTAGDEMNFLAGDPQNLNGGGTIHVQTDIGGLSINVGNTGLEADIISIYADLLGGDVTFSARVATLQASEIYFIAPSEGGKIIFNYQSQVLFDVSFTQIAAFLTIPMTDEDIIPGTFCSNTDANVASIVIARSPPYDVFSYQMNLRDHPFGYGEMGYDAVFDPQSLYAGLGLRLCSCLDSAWRCMTMSQFYY